MTVSVGCLGRNEPGHRLNQEQNGKALDALPDPDGHMVLPTMFPWHSEGPG